MSIALVAVRVVTFPRAMKIVRLFNRKKTRLPLVTIELEQLAAGTIPDASRTLESEIVVLKASKAGELYQLTIHREVPDHG